MKNWYTIEKNNAYAIRMLDKGEVDLSRNLFLKNYRYQKTPMTMINLAVFLTDEHFMIHRNTVFDSIIANFRLCHARRILNRCKKSHVLDSSAEYHLEYLLGSIEVSQRHYQHAIKHFEEEEKIKQTSIEAISMLAWLYTLQRNYTNAFAKLVKLARELTLGDDIEENLEVIDDKCPFIRFPYYQLIVYVLSYVNPDEAKKVLDKMINTSFRSDELLFPEEELILLCLHLRHYSNMKNLLTYLESDPWKSSDCINAMYFMLKAIRDKSKIECDENDVAVYSSWISKFTYTIKRTGSKNDLDYILRKCFFPVARECHFLNCPIH